MFYVWEFDAIGECWVPAGAFSLRAEADALAAESQAAGRNGHALEEPFEVFVDRAVRSRLGDLAEALDRITGAPPRDNDPRILWGKQGFPVVVARRPAY
jgi:hypothetical protein